MSGTNLFSPFPLGPTVLRNRIVMTPMTRARAGFERLPNTRLAKYYSDRASAGLIITEGTVISDQAIGWNQSPGIYTDAMQRGWREIVDAVHRADGVIFMHLWHTGRASHSSFHADGSRPVAPSAIAINGISIHKPNGKQSYEAPRALETAEIPGVVEDFHARHRWEFCSPVRTGAQRSCFTS